MKLRDIALICILASTTSAFAGPQATATAISPSILRGTFAITEDSPRYVNWWAQVSCKNYSGNLGAGSDVGNQIIDGTAIFDGKGNVTLSFTQYGEFDQELSNQTVVWECDSNGNPYIVNSGYAVYDPPTPGSITGTYTVQSDYTGQLNFSDGGHVKFRLSGVTYLGIATSFTFLDLSDKSNAGHGVGHGNIQNCIRFCVP